MGCVFLAGHRHLICYHANTQRPDMLGHSRVLFRDHTWSLRTIKFLLLLFEPCYVCTVHPWHFHNIRQEEVQTQALATPCPRK